MTKVSVSQYWKALDDDAAKNFTQSTASNVRQSNSSRVVENLAHGVNHLLARNPRVNFQTAQFRTLCTNGVNALYRWKYNDNIANHGAYGYIVVGIPRTTGTTNSYWEQYPAANHYDANAVSSHRNVTISPVNAYYDVFYDSVVQWRNSGVGTKAGGVILDGVSTYNGFTALCVVQQDLILPYLDTDDHVYCDPTLAKKGGKVLADAAEEIRTGLHAARSTNLGRVMSWSAQSSDGNVAVPGDQTGATVTSNVPVNLFDQSVTQWQANSPGAFVGLYNCGRGLNSTAAGSQVKIRCDVYAKADGNSGSDANVKFLTPYGELDIAIPIGGGLGWYGNAATTIYANSTIENDETDATANKLDVLGCVADNTWATDYLNVYDVEAWIEYE